jgi:uncharacterized damage-inducible protein DinB
MQYAFTAIPENLIPLAGERIFQHVLDTYASETNKVISIWRSFREDDLEYRLQPRSSSVIDILKHQLLSERRFFAEFLGTPEPPAAEVLPGTIDIDAFCNRMCDLVLPRLAHLANRDTQWWLESVPFFDVTRERIWIFWRRVLHTAHHRTQLTVYLRMLGRPVPPVYGPTADVSWTGADPTHTVEAAKRR